MKMTNQFVYTDTFHLSGILERNGVSEKDQQEILKAATDKDTYIISYYKDTVGNNFRFINKNGLSVHWSSIPHYVRDRVWDFEEKTKSLH
ncbi:hypothetical protein [Halobacillus litoralis]|uniref:hypothetical protein n=1 Tax=Halobacillus litoralis TaxID=45668 RepID=UPI001CD62A9A|nr:hypothetical protein [Halobacillus litoralis]MCA1021602.1 hypothetical protein [Halobacillus litoralis]